MPLAQHEVLDRRLGTTADDGARERHEEQEGVQHRFGMMPRRRSRWRTAFRAPTGERIVSREVVRWYAPRRGYASSGAGEDAFGLANDLNLVRVEPSEGGTLVTMDEYYDARDLDLMKAHFDDAFADIGEHLVRRFGGRVLDRFVGH